MPWRIPVEVSHPPHQPPPQKKTIKEMEEQMAEGKM